MTTTRRRTVRPRSGKARRGITVQIHPEKHQELLAWLDQQESIQATILNALYAKMLSEGDSLEDTKPMAVPALEPDPTLFTQLYDALIGHMDQQHRETRAMLRDLRGNMGSVSAETKPSELKPEFKAAIRATMKPGKSI